MVDPSGASVLKDLKFITRCDIFPVIAGEYTLRNAIERYYESNEAQMETLLKDITAVARGASDIHFECFEHELRVRYGIAAVGEGMLTLRMDGWLKVIMGITTLDHVVRETSM